MKEDWDLIQILRHYRHDWLNFVQLIKGNIALKKYDRVEEIIQEIINQTQNESKLSNLQVPLFASNIIVFNWEKNNFFHLEFEVAGESKDLSKYDQSLVSMFQEFTSILNNTCQQYADNHLLLRIETVCDGFLKIAFDFQGSIIDDEKLKRFVEETFTKNEQMHLEEFYINKEEFYFAVKII